MAADTHLSIRARVWTRKCGDACVNADGARHMDACVKDARPIPCLLHAAVWSAMFVVTDVLADSRMD
jgi:hypothetical protein